MQREQEKAGEATTPQPPEILQRGAAIGIRRGKQGEDGRGYKALTLTEEIEKGI